MQAVGGTARPGQVQMAEAVEQPSTPASTCWCRPAPVRASRWPTWCRPSRTRMATGRPVVVATATLALQAQVVDRDLPRVSEALAPLLGRRTTYAAGQGPAQLPVQAQARRRLPGGGGRRLFDARAGGATPEPARCRGACGCATGPTRRRPATATSWCPASASGPGARCRCRRTSAWAAKCPLVEECFVEQARGRPRGGRRRRHQPRHAGHRRLRGTPICCPSTTLVVVDEGHELVDRVTSAITDELTRGHGRAGRPPRGTGSPDADGAERRRRRAARRAGAAAARTADRPAARPSPRRSPGARRGPGRARPPSSPRRARRSTAPRQVARAEVEEVFDVSDRLLARADHDVVWLSDEPRRGHGPARRTDHGGRPAARAALRRAHRGAHLGHARAGWHVRRRGALGRALAGPDAPAWPGSTSAARSTTRSRRSCTSPSTCRRRGATATSAAAMDELADLVTRGRWSHPRAVLARRGRPRRRPRRCASDSTSRCCCQGDDQTPDAGARLRPRRRRPACSARCRSGRASTCPGRPASWW